MVVDGRKVVLALFGLVLSGCAPFQTRPLDSLERLLLQERYADVLAHSSRERLVHINLYSSLVAHDIAQVMVHGRAAPPLLCAPILERYPTTIATTMEVCRQLQKKLAGELVSDEELLAMDDIARRQFPRERYLVTVMTRVRAAPLK